MLNLAQAARSLAEGALLVYPTETFYALGCLARNPEAVARLREVKGREPGKALPLLLGDPAQLDAIVDHLPPGVEALLDAFWPGPLTVLFPARRDLPPGVAAADGMVAARQSGHAAARRLALLAGGPLVATSANKAGQPPAAAFKDLDPAIAMASAGVLLDGDLPAGGAPSTIVRPLGTGVLALVRPGAVPAAALEAAGWRLTGMES